MAISSIGIGSGLPLEQLLADLRKGENQTLALIQSRQITVQSRLSAYGTIKSSIEALKTASDALGKADTFGALKTSVSGDSFTASASTKAIAGQYSIKVEQLATPQTLRTGPQLDSKTAYATSGGSETVDIEFTLADGESKKTLTLGKSETSLEGMIKAINADSSLGLSATMIKGGTDGKEHYLLLTSKATGTEAAVHEIRVTDSGTATVNQGLDDVIGFKKTLVSPPPSEPEDTFSGAMTEQAAKNAKLTINDIAITGQTNTITDAIEGVILTLTKANTDGAAAPASLSITRDDAVTSKAVNAFITAYNALQNQIKSLSAYDVENQRSSALTGDSLTRKVQSQVRDVLNVAGDSGVIRYLSQMGITTNVIDGTLKVDNDKLAAALKDNMGDVQSLFAGDNGISKRLSAVADTFIRSDGLIPSASEGINRSINDLAKQFDAASVRIDAKMEAYRQQFTKLDGLVMQMNSVSSYLTQQLSMLGNMNDRK